MRDRPGDPRRDALVSHNVLDLTHDAEGNIASAGYAPLPLTAESRTMLVPPVSGFDEASGTVEAAAVVYGVTDSYNTRFLRGAFNEWLDRDLAKGVVPLVWSHNHSRRVGRLVDYKDLPDKLVVVAQLDDPNAPEMPEGRAKWIRKAWDGLKRGILDEVSVAVTRDQTRTAADGALEFVKARMIHLGIVLEGAVPGAVVLGVRQPGPKVPDLSPLFAASAAPGPEASPPAPLAPEIAYYARMDRAYELAGLDPTRAPDPVDEALAEADAALALLEGRLARHDIDTAIADSRRLQGG